MQTNLSVILRTELGKKSIVRDLRSKGYVPGICYGALKESIPVYISAKELRLALSTEAKEHVLLNLKTDKKSEVDKKIAILKDLVKHPTKRTYIHADLQVLDMTKPLKVSVDVRLTGKPEGLKMGGVLDQVRRTVEILCLPTDIPSHLDVDISALNVGDTLHVSDIEAPEGVEITTSENLTIANIVIPARAKTAEELAEEEALAEEAAVEAAVTEEKAETAEE